MEDESWDDVSDEELEEFAEAWMVELRGDISSAVVQMNFSALPILQWQFIQKAVKYAESDHELFTIAAGPMEHLLVTHGPDFIDRVEETAKTDAKFAKVLTGVWKHTMQEEVWARLQSIIEKYAKEKEEDKYPPFSDQYYEELFVNSIQTVVLQLGSYGEAFINLIEKQAVKDDRFAKLLHKISIGNTEKALWMRLKTIATKYAPPENLSENTVN